MQKPRVGLALGGGAARGLAHIGILEILANEGIPVDIVTGTSIGAIIGGIYCAGGDMKWLEKLVLTLKWDQLIDLAVPRMGFFRPEKLLHMLELLCKQKKIEDLAIQFGAVAVDISTGEEILLDHGDTARAVLASSAIPGVFLPQEISGKLLVDGGIRTRVPVEPARQLGADLVIAVDVGGPVVSMEVKSVIDVILQSIEIMQAEANEAKTERADVLIRPEVGNVGPFDLNSAHQTIDSGRRAAKEKLPDIIAVLDRVGRSCERRVDYEQASTQVEAGG